MLNASALSRSHASTQASQVAMRLTRLERATLFLSIVVIPLSIDKAFFFREQDAMLGAVGGLCISLTTIALIALYAIWFADAALHRRRMIFRPLLGIPMLFYLLIVLASAAVALVPALSLFDFALLAHAYLLFFFIANRIQTHRDVLFCVLALAAGLFLESMLIFLAVAMGMDNEVRSIGPFVLTVWADRRHGGTLQSPVLAGSTMAMIWLPVAASLLILREKWSWRFTLLTISAGILAILLTQTRGAILTTLVGTIIIGGGMLLRGRLPKWSLAVAAACCLIGLYPLFLVYQKRIQAGDDGSAVGRVHLTKIALETIAERPIAGFGAGNCHLATLRIAEQAEYRAEWFYTTHSKYLLVWVETGLVGLLAFVAILGNGFRHGIAAWRTRDPILSTLGLALVAALAGHMLHMAVDLFNSPAQVQILWILLGLMAAIYKLSHPHAFLDETGARRAPLRHPRHARAFAAVVQPQTRQFDHGAT